jgi:soluble lytic murein transglycosylase
MRRTFAPSRPTLCRRRVPLRAALRLMVVPLVCLARPEIGVADGLTAASAAAAAEPPSLRLAEQRETFQRAWRSAASGDRATFHELRPALEDYELFPYWQYEDYRARRSSVPAAEMAAFLEGHEDWAFTNGLRSAWLKALGKRRDWEALATYGDGARGAELKCFRARARLALGDLDGLLDEARGLWTVGRSQPDACDPLFAWMMDQGGVTPDLAWERIRLAMEEGNPRLTLYLARFLSGDDARWLERWQRLNSDRYRRLEGAATWPDNELSRMITSESLRRLANRDALAALRAFRKLDGHIRWDPDTRAMIMRRIALMGAVDLEPEMLGFMRDLPPAARDDQLVQWWARLALSIAAKNGDWGEVFTALDQLSETAAGEDRWRYWRARALLATGAADQGLRLLEDLAGSTGYYGFLAADALRRPYTVCEQDPAVEPRAVQQLASREDFSRALELRRAGLDNWALAEWGRATRRIDAGQLKLAAALAIEEQWHDRAIFALGNSGDLRLYEWRFPLLWQESVLRAAVDKNLDPAWMFGIMRSESAMTESARSPAGALGLMQVMPGTARQLSRQHGIPYRSRSDLLQADRNIGFGSAYLRDLLDEYRDNPVLVSAAYNAGPNAVDRWLRERPLDEAALWVETLPYYETRDYIPRVLAFTTLYDWRLQNPVRRVSSRMPGIDSGTILTEETTQVVCRADREMLVDADP